MDLREVSGELSVRHPWERARFEFFYRLLRDHASLQSAERILDVGAGDGWFARSLLARVAPTASIVCVDAGYDRTRLPVSGPRLEFSPSLPDGRFDLLLFLDVLEHVENDRGFLPEVIRRNAGPGSRALLAAPAWEILTTSHDKWLAHYRRYTPAQLVGLAEEAGLRPIRKGSLFTSLLIARAASAVRERVVRREDLAPSQLHWRHGEVAARAVHAALSVDAGLSRAASERGWSIPGLSTWVLCEAR